MKNFKVIVSLVTLIAVGTASAAQQGKKLTNDEKLNLLTALKKEKELTQQVSKGKELTQTQAKDYQQQELLINKFQQTKDPYVTQQIEKSKIEIQKTIPQASQAIASIASQVKALPVIKYDKPVPLTQQASIMKNLENSKNWNDFIANTKKNISIIYDNGELQQTWFNLAADLAYKFNSKLKTDEITSQLNDAANSILFPFIDNKNLNSEDIAGLVDVAIHDYFLPAKGTYKPAIRPTFSPSLVGSQILVEQSKSPTTQSKSENPKVFQAELLSDIPFVEKQNVESISGGQKALPVIWNKPSEKASETYSPKQKTAEQPIIITSQPSSEQSEVTKDFDLLLIDAADDKIKNMANLQDQTLVHPKALWYKEKLQPQWFKYAIDKAIQFGFTTINAAFDEVYKIATAAIKKLTQQKELPQLLTDQIKLEALTAANFSFASSQKATDNEIMLLLNQSKILDEFFTTTTKNPTVFYKNNHIQQDWFNLAVKKMYEIEGTKAEKNSVTNHLREKAYTLYANAIGKEIKNLSLGDTNIIDLCIRQAFSKNKIA